MTLDDISLIEWLFKSAVGSVFIVGWWMWRQLVQIVVKTKDDLNTHKLHVSESYAKKEELRPIYDCLTSIQNDVKTLLSRHL